MPSRLARSAPFLLALVGWATSLYLLSRTLAVARGGGTGDLCSAVFGTGCDETLASPTAWQLGVPLAGWGLVYFAVVALLVAVGARGTARAALTLTAGGVGASLVMVAWIAAGRVALCPLCLVVHAANFGLLAVIWRGGVWRGDGESDARRWAAAALAAVALGAGFQLAPPDIGGHDVASPDGDAVVAAWEAEERVAIPPRPEEPAAPVTVAVFSSFQCPGCKSFAAVASHLAEHFGADVTLAYRHFPLERECNTAVGRDLQPRSCEAARAAEAARLQGAFQGFHDGLFASDLSASEDLLTAIAIDTGVDLGRWEADRKSFAVAQQVLADARLGAELAVTATPTVYVNGRRLAEPSLPALEVVVGHVLGRGHAH